MVQTEGDFLAAKINWALSGSSTINAPAVGTSGSQLSVNKVINPNGDVAPLTINLENGDMWLTYPSDDGGQDTYKLNNTNITVSDLEYTYTKSEGNGVAPERIDTTFTVTAKTPTGATVSQEFSITNYVRK
jgi:hypothetical protein